MDRQIARYGYWIGLACMLISLVWRGLTLLWAGIPEKLGLVWYSTFWKGGALLLLVSIASVNYAWLQRQATQDKPERTTARAA